MFISRKILETFAAQTCHLPEIACFSSILKAIELSGIFTSSVLQLISALALEHKTTTTICV